MAADGLSRREEDMDDPNLLMVTTIESYWLDQVRKSVETDEYFLKLSAQWEGGQLNPGTYQKKGCLLLQKQNPGQPC